MKTEILLITEAGYPWSIGGVSSWIRDLIDGLPEHEFTVLGLRFAEGAGVVAAGPAPLLPRGARFIDVCLQPGVEIAAVVQGAVQAAAGCEPALVQASSSGVAGIVALALSRACGAPLIVTEHGIAWAETADRAAPDRQRFAGSGLLRRRDVHASIFFLTGDRIASAREIYAHAACITSVSHANTRLQRSLVPAGTPIRVVPNGVEPREPATPATDRPRTVVFAGRVAPEKGVDRFVRTAALLGARHRELRFEVRGPAGDTGYAARCAALAAEAGLQDRLVFGGPRPRATLFAGADLLILPSRIEACPYALLEAMAAGVPAVVADVGDCAAIAGDAGLLVSGDERDFARAAEVLLDPEAHAAAIEAGRMRVASWYGRGRMLAAYRTLYGRLQQLPRGLQRSA